MKNDISKPQKKLCEMMNLIFFFYLWSEYYQDDFFLWIHSEATTLSLISHQCIRKEPNWMAVVFNNHQQAT